jgi:hypothetical protein
MSKVYLARHQAHGPLWQFPFASAPTDDQLAVLANYCARLHGEKHPKTGEAYFLKVEELELLTPSDVPQALIPAGGSSRDNTAAVGQFGVSGVGHVSNPKGAS